MKKLWMVWALLAPIAARARAAPNSGLEVSIHSPSPGSSVAGRLILSANASSAEAVTGIQFKLDGTDLGLKSVVSPYALDWDSTLVADGTHTVTAVAWDASGASTSTTVMVNVVNQAPAITSVSAASIGATNATILWLTSQPSDSQADFGASSLYGSSSVPDSALVSTHTVSLIGLLPNTTYHYRVKSRSGSGVQALSGDFTFATYPAGTGASAIAATISAKSPRRFLTPANPSVTFGPDAQEVNVFDLRGRQVFHTSEGGSPIVWNGRDESGRAVESGVYIAKIRTPDGTLYQSLAVVK